MLPSAESDAILMPPLPQLVPFLGSLGTGLTTPGPSYGSLGTGLTIPGPSFDSLGTGLTTPGPSHGSLGTGRTTLETTPLERQNFKGPRHLPK